MTEIEKDLKKEQQDKKRTAHSAYKHVGRTKKCTLPFETMPKEERKKYMEASEVKTVKLAPMPLEEFDKQPEYIQKELLVWYGEKYGWNAAGVAAALGCDYSTAKRRLSSYDMLYVFTNHSKAQSKLQKMEAHERRRRLEDGKSPTQEETKEVPLTPPEEKKEVQPPHSSPTGEYEVSLNCEKGGFILQNYLSGIAHSLDPMGIYKVSLSIVHVGEQKPHREPCSYPEK